MKDFLRSFGCILIGGIILLIIIYLGYLAEQWLEQNAYQQLIRDMI